MLVFISCNQESSTVNHEKNIFSDTSIYYYMNNDTFLISYHRVFDSINNKIQPPIRIGKWRFFHPNKNIRQIDEYNSFGKLIGRLKYNDSGILKYDFVLKNEDTSFIKKYSETGDLIYYEEFYSTEQKDTWGTLRISKYYSNGLLEKKIIDSIDNTVEIVYFPNGRKASYRDITYYDDYNGKIIEWDSIGSLLLDTDLKSEYMIYY